MHTYTHIHTGSHVERGSEKEKDVRKDQRTGSENMHSQVAQHDMFVSQSASDSKKAQQPGPKQQEKRLGRMFSGMGNRFSLAIALRFEDTGACARGTHLVHGSAGDDKERREEELERVLPDLPLDGGDGLAHGARLPDRHATSGFCSLSRL